jgi:hypothetical protein
MNIIFADKNHHMYEKYTMLELDTFLFKSTGVEQTAWCVIENVPLSEFSLLESYTQAHSNLIKQYQDRNWEYCRSAIKSLYGRWNGELDTFYDELIKRIDGFETTPPPDSWRGVIERD